MEWESCLLMMNAGGWWYLLCFLHSYLSALSGLLWADQFKMRGFVTIKKVSLIYETLGRKSFALNRAKSGKGWFERQQIRWEVGAVCLFAKLILNIPTHCYSAPGLSGKSWLFITLSWDPILPCISYFPAYWHSRSVSRSNLVTRTAIIIKISCSTDSPQF